MTEISIKRLLLIEDNLGDARLLREMFNERVAYKTKITHVQTMLEAEAHLGEYGADIIIARSRFAGRQGTDRSAAGAFRRADCCDSSVDSIGDRSELHGGAA